MSDFNRDDDIRRIRPREGIPNLVRTRATGERQEGVPQMSSYDPPRVRGYGSYARYRDNDGNNNRRYRQPRGMDEDVYADLRERPSTGGDRRRSYNQPRHLDRLPRGTQWPPSRPIPYRPRSRSRSRRRRQPYLQPQFYSQSRSRSGSPSSSRIAMRRSTSHEEQTDKDTSEASDEEYARLGGRRIESANNDEVYDGAPSTVYTFTPRRTQAPSQESSLDTDEALGKEEDGSIQASPGGSGSKEDANYQRLLHVFQSQYMGDSVLGGLHGVNITAVAGSLPKVEPLFRWVENGWTLKTFHCPGLSAAELKGLRDVLALVQRKFLQPVRTADGRTVHHMEPFCIQRVLPVDSSAKASSLSRRTVTWVCLPYFSLEEYSGLQACPRESAAFPIETLLQTLFSRETRERDMQQAVRQSFGKEMPPRFCYHVAQIWCLVVDNAFLFSYGRMSEESLRSDIIRVQEPSETSIPPKIGTGNGSFVTVAYKKAIVWSFPMDECQTWLAFHSHFGDFWPQRLAFFRRRHLVTADDWPRICHSAHRVKTRISLEVQLQPNASPLRSGVLLSLGDDDAKPSTLDGKECNRADAPGQADTSTITDAVNTSNAKAMTISMFTCLEGVIRPDDAAINEDVLRDHLRETEEYIRLQTPYSDRQAYATCPEAARQEIYALLKQTGTRLAEASVDNAARHPMAQQASYERALNIFNATSVVFSFYFPLGIHVPTVEKFWGAVRIIVLDILPATTRPEKFSIATHTQKSLLSDLRSLCMIIHVFHEIFEQSSRQEQAKIAVPTEIMRSWMHLLMGLIFLPNDAARSERLMDDAKSLFHRGIEMVVRSLTKADLLEASVVLPLELLSLFSHRLLRDTTVGLSDINKCYSDSLQKMDADITSKASDRSREYRIGLLMQEIVAVQNVVCKQAKIFLFLLDTEYSWMSHEDDAIQDPQQSMQRWTSLGGEGQYQNIPRPKPRGSSGREYDQPKRQPASRSVMSRSRPILESYVYTFDTGSSTDLGLLSTDPGGYRMLLLSECMQFVNGRQSDFDGFRSWASTLEKVNRNKIDTTKDRHDNAIYAFTIVTIIFLPLSSVASVFGMNTNDVRNMELNQWAYWATAVPVTIVVIFLGLLWTGELGNLLRWIQSFGTPQGYVLLPDDVREDGGEGGDGRYDQIRVGRDENGYRVRRR